MPTSLDEVLIVAACLLAGVVLGLPAVIRALRHLKQGGRSREDEAANDEHFLA